MHDAVEFVEVAAIPGPQAVAQPMHLAKPGLGRQRHGVDVGQCDVSPGLGRVFTALVGAQCRRHHLLEFFRDGGGAAFRRMAVFFKLRGQRAAARRASGIASHGVYGCAPHGVCQSAPFDSRITPGLMGVKQFTVFDE